MPFRKPILGREQTLVVGVPIALWRQVKDVYKSVDDGNNWTQVFNCNGCRFTAIDKLDSNIVYAGGENGVWRSLDAGVNWTDISHSEMPTNNGDEFWDYNYQGVFDIATDPNNQNTVYVTAFGENKGLYKSTDNGTNWNKILTDDFMRKVAIVPVNSDLIYAASSSAFQAGGYNSNSSGVLYSEDGGQTWSQQNQGMAYPFALAVAIDNLTEPTVYVGSPGTGFQKSAVPETSLSTGLNTENKYVIYPNPTANVLTIEASSQKLNQLQIFNVIGQEVTHAVHFKEQSFNKMVIDISNLSTGIYYIISEEINAAIGKQ